MSAAPITPLPLSTSGHTAAEVARQVALQAGATLRRAFRSSMIDVSQKGRADVVTDIDVAVEKQARDFLRREFPAFGFIGEESGAVKGSAPYTWIVDPIDGTANFVRGIPHFAMTLGLLHGEDISVGVTYDPIRQDLFTAVAGGGVTVNGQPGRPSQATDFREVTLGFDTASDETLVARSFDIVRSLLPLHRARLLGSGALGLAYVAVGWYDLYFHLELKPWDVAAGLLFIQESEGDAICVDAQGDPATLESGSFFAGNEGLLEQFMQRTAAQRIS